MVTRCRLPRGEGDLFGGDRGVGGQTPYVIRALGPISAV